MNFKSIYNFWDLPPSKQAGLVGKFVDAKDGHGVFLPIHLSNPNSNYGEPYGLIYISPILNSGGVKWLRVAAKSPDDLDMDLDFEGEKLSKLRRKILKFLPTLNLQRVSYSGILTQVQAKFGGKLS